MPLVAAKDIGRYVARLLVTTDFPSDRVVELHGGGHYTFIEATAILGAAMGRTVAYETVPLTQARTGMIGNGMSASFADALIETAESFNRGERWVLESSTPRNTAPTTLESWADGGGYLGSGGQTRQG